MIQLQTDGAMGLLNKQELPVDKKRESSPLFHFCLNPNKPGCFIRNSWTELICWTLNWYPSKQERAWAHFDYVIGKKETTAEVISAWVTQASDILALEIIFANDTYRYFFWPKIEANGNAEAGKLNSIVWDHKSCLALRGGGGVLADYMMGRSDVSFLVENLHPRYFFGSRNPLRIFIGFKVCLIE